MDIQRWLNETELPEQPPSPAKRRDPAPRLPVKEFDQAPLGNRRRKPSTSDSSLLESPPQIKKAQPLAPQKGSDEGADESACSDASRSSTSSESSTSSDPYARRPRRKTRIERYEPASKHIKERGTHSRRHRKGEPSRTKRKRKRKVDNVGIGTVQGFQAKNVSKDRLTVSSGTHLARRGSIDDWCSSSRQKNWDCSARAGRQHQSRAVVVSTLCSAPHIKPMSDLL